MAINACGRGWVSMAWIVGIDEAGYGPNLGPLVMSAVACRLPEDLVAVNHWQRLRRAVRKGCEPADDRLLVDDSKVVYSTARGLAELETALFATLLAGWQSSTIGQCLEQLCPESLYPLRAERWYLGNRTLPVTNPPSHLELAAKRFRSACDDQPMRWGPVRSVVLCPPRFNQILERWGSKGAVLGQALADLLLSLSHVHDSDDAVYFFVDKHGGRNTYTALLQQALAPGVIVVHEEGPGRSVYGVLGVGRDMRFTIEPRADAAHFCVALASMVSKYLREILMLDFNAFWQTHVPGVKPTAGYPGDAARFYREIAPAAARLRIPETALWRLK
jgi:ribonuclease HII